jgi:hypothetical protein
MLYRSYSVIEIASSGGHQSQREVAVGDCSRHGRLRQPRPQFRGGGALCNGIGVVLCMSTESQPLSLQAAVLQQAVTSATTEVAPDDI